MFGQLWPWHWLYIRTEANNELITMVAMFMINIQMCPTTCTNDQTEMLQLSRYRETPFCINSYVSEMLARQKRTAEKQHSKEQRNPLLWNLRRAKRRKRKDKMYSKRNDIKCKIIKLLYAFVWLLLYFITFAHIRYNNFLFVYFLHFSFLQINFAQTISGILTV